MANIKQDDILVGILSVAGQPIYPTGTYEGSYSIKPLPNRAQVLGTKNKMMLDDLTVLEIPYWEVSNTSGKTVIIGGSR